MKDLRALIFDVDGTLAETEEIHRQAFNQTFLNKGLSWKWSEEKYKELLKISGGLERLSAYKLEVEQKNSSISSELLSEIHETKTKKFAELVKKKKNLLRPGIKALIEAAKAKGILVAAATATSMPNLEVLCQSSWGLPAREVFYTTATGNEVIKKKPAPDIFLLALERLRISASSALALEDSRNGLLSAKSAGLTTIVCPSKYTLFENFNEADFICKSYVKNQLPNFLTNKIFSNRNS